MDFADVLELGGNLGWIRCSDYGGHEVKGKGWLTDMLRQLNDFLAICDIEDEIIFCEIEEWIKRLNRSYRAGQKISKKDGKELSDQSDRWGDLIYKELCAKPCIEFQKGALNQRALILTSRGKPSVIFERKVWRELPKIARSDYSDAAKCLLVEASTPATMVALRGIEAVIRRYYFLKTKKKAGKKNMGNIIEELREIPDINEQLISYLDYIRSEKRNIAQHPTKVFNQKEAERIFMEIVSATHDISTEMLRSS